jgi:hypothetical protein
MMPVLLTQRRSAVRPVPPAPPIAHATSPRTESPESELAPPRRIAKGTSPVGSTQPGVAVVRPPRAQADDVTVTDLSLDHTVTDLAVDGDHTTPSLQLPDHTKPGLALPSIRGRLQR